MNALQFCIFLFHLDPSLRDIENQTNYQILFRDEQHKREPFVGVIIGPYDTRLKSEESVINWFHVESMPEYKVFPFLCSFLSFVR
jgi:hypothetical protein